MATKPKRMTRKELNEQDEVMTSLQQIYAGLTKYRLHIIVGAVLLIAVLLGSSGVVNWLDSKEIALAGDYEKAVATASAPVIAEGEEVPEVIKTKKIETFATDEARMAEAAKRIEAFRVENAGSDLDGAAMLALASVQFEQREWKKAEDTLNAYMAENAESPYAPFAMEQLGIAALAQKRAADAEKWFKKLVDSDSAYFKAVGHAHLGDLANPRIAAGAKDGAKAKAAYEAALAALTAGERKVAPAERSLEEGLKRKLALLD